MLNDVKWEDDPEGPEQRGEKNRSILKHNQRDKKGRKKTRFRNTSETLENENEA